MAIIKQPLSNLKLSKLGADISTGYDYAYGTALQAGRTSLGDTFKLASKNISIPGLADGGILGKYDGYYRNGNISFSSLFSGSYLDGSLGQVVYHKNVSIDTGQWRSNVPGAPYYTSNGSASGAMIAGTNGDLNGAFIGYGPNYESYYMWGGNSKHWRIGVNIYRLSADGTEFQRVYTHHHLADSIGDQSSVSIGLGNFEPTQNIKYTGTIYRLQDNGNPILALGGYNISANTVNGNGYMPRIYLNGVNQWGQPLDAIDTGDNDSGLRTGLFLWQRQWWGPRLIGFKHNGSTITTQNAQSMDVFYQGWIFDHHFGGQGGVAWSPVSKRAVVIFTYEPNGTTYGRNMAINNVIFEPEEAAFVSPPDTDIIHFIWGGGEECKPDLGQYTGGAIDYMCSNEPYGDFFAYAFMNVSNDRLYVRLATVNWNEWRGGNNKCNWPELGEAIYSGINHLQRVRVTRLNVITNQNGNPIIHFAVSYVNSSNQTIVKIFRGGPETPFAEIASYTPNNRGLLARNGGPSGLGNGAGRGQHAIVVGTTNDGAQTTYTWDGSKSGSLSRSGDQDLTRAIKLV